MLRSPRSITPTDVGTHYDRLDWFYRALWGKHLHHGLWDTKDDHSVEKGTTSLLELLLAPLEPGPGSRVIDIGCGYGADARRIAEQSGAHVTGLTISLSQAARAQAEPPPVRGTVQIAHGDWLQNNFPGNSFDYGLAIESLSHMPDKEAFFFELHRTLLPGGRAALACWTVAPDPAGLEHLFLRYLCLEGTLPSLGTMADYDQFAENAGLSMTARRDLTQLVEPTWGVIAQRILGTLPKPRFLGPALGLALRRPLLVFTIPIMILAYRTGALRYTAFWLEKRS
ncbi:MAG: class I SAM-dependent methyltransferase [Roseibacillus sp.]|nr:class I SAM-dependent methyltransferase [Roseibacillus sp.]